MLDGDFDQIGDPLSLQWYKHIPTHTHTHTHAHTYACMHCSSTYCCFATPNTYRWVDIARSGAEPIKVIQTWMKFIKNWSNLLLVQTKECLTNKNYTATRWHKYAQAHVHIYVPYVEEWYECFAVSLYWRYRVTMQSHRCNGIPWRSRLHGQHRWILFQSNACRCQEEVVVCTHKYMHTYLRMCVCAYVRMFITHFNKRRSVVVNTNRNNATQFNSYWKERLWKAKNQQQQQ